MTMTFHGCSVNCFFSCTEPLPLLFPSRRCKSFPSRSLCAAMLADLLLICCVEDRGHRSRASMQAAEGATHSIRAGSEDAGASNDMLPSSWPPHSRHSSAVQARLGHNDWSTSRLESSILHIYLCKGYYAHRIHGAMYDAALPAVSAGKASGGNCGVDALLQHCIPQVSMRCMQSCVCCAVSRAWSRWPSCRQLAVTLGCSVQSMSGKPVQNNTRAERAMGGEHASHRQQRGAQHATGWPCWAQQQHQLTLRAMLTFVTRRQQQDCIAPSCVTAACLSSCSPLTHFIHGAITTVNILVDCYLAQLDQVCAHAVRHDIMSFRGALQ